jgi:hypothetical protein
MAKMPMIMTKMPMIVGLTIAALSLAACFNRGDFGPGIGKAP